MYKKQLVFQKYACLFAVIAAAVSFVYSLGIITDIYDTLYSTMMNPADLTQTFVPGSIIYYENGKTGTCGLIEWEGDYYYVYWGGVVKTGKQYASTTYCDQWSQITS